MMSRVRKRLSAEERKERILSAAVRAFASDGYDNARMDEIATGAGITKPVLYDHFPSKQALFLSVLQSIRDGLIAKGQAIVQDDCEPEQKFRRAIEAFFLFVEQEPQAARVLLTMPSDPVAAQLSSQVQAGASAKLALLLAAFMQDGGTRRLEAAAEFLKQGLHALALWGLGHPGVGREELVDIVMRIAWTGLEARDAQPEPRGRKAPDQRTRGDER